MTQAVDNGHYFFAGWGEYFIVRGNTVKMYTVDQLKGNMISTERQLLFSVDANSGVVHWSGAAKDRTDTMSVAQKFVETVKQGNFSNPLSTTQDFYGYVDFQGQVYNDLRAYRDKIMDLTQHPELPAPIYVPKPQQKTSISGATPVNPAQPVSPNIARDANGRPLVRQ